jgi:hypothetical protein
MGFRLYLCGDLDGYRMRFFSGHAMLGVMTRLPGDADQTGAQAFVDQKPHDTGMVSTRRRARRTGLLSRQG